jgi:maleate isomerase
MTDETNLATPSFADTAPRRIGLIVPSSNTTMETEIPALLAGMTEPHTFHSSRARLHTVDADSLAKMVADSDRCAAELADARVDVIAYACLVAVMSAGPGAHERIEDQLTAATRANGCDAPVVSSAGALVRTLVDLGLRNVAVVAPYVPALTKTVIAYLRGYDINVVDWVTLGVAGNCDVGQLDPDSLLNHARTLDLSHADGLVLSACVQMPSLPAVETVEQALGVPVITAATATTREILQAIGEQPVAARGGHALRDVRIGVTS